jgi:hypothetical protein
MSWHPPASMENRRICLLLYMAVILLLLYLPARLTKVPPLCHFNRGVHMGQKTSRILRSCSPKEISEQALFFPQLESSVNG